MKQRKRFIAHKLRAALGGSVIAIPAVSIAVGVSVPAGAVPKVKEKTTLRDSAARKTTRQSSGERGHVRRRNDVIRKDSHVEKKRGWHKVE